MPESSKGIVEIIKSNLGSSSTSIPVFHPVALRLQQMLARPDFSVHELGRLIKADPGLATRVLRVGNSSFYAGLSKVSTIEEAIVRLGSRELVNVVMLATQKDLYHSQDPRYNVIMESLWKHSFCCAVGSSWIAKRTGYGQLAQEAFLGGLLHDIGKLFLLKVMEKLGQDEEFRQSTTPAIVEEVFDSLHVEQGYQLMCNWSMPEMYCVVVRDHDADQWDQENDLLNIVRLANLGCRALGIGLNSDPTLLLLTTAEAHRLGLHEVALAELEIVMEDAGRNPLAALD